MMQNTEFTEEKGAWTVVGGKNKKKNQGNPLALMTDFITQSSVIQTKKAAETVAPPPEKSGLSHFSENLADKGKTAIFLTPFNLNRQIRSSKKPVKIGDAINSQLLDLGVSQPKPSSPLDGSLLPRLVPELLDMADKSLSCGVCEIQIPQLDQVHVASQPFIASVSKLPTSSNPSKQTTSNSSDESIIPSQYLSARKRETVRGPVNSGPHGEGCLELTHTLVAAPVNAAAKAADSRQFFQDF